MTRETVNSLAKYVETDIWTWSFTVNSCTQVTICTGQFTKKNSNEYPPKLTNSTHTMSCARTCINIHVRAEYTWTHVCTHQHKHLYRQKLGVHTNLFYLCLLLVYLCLLCHRSRPTTQTLQLRFVLIVWLCQSVNGFGRLVVALRSESVSRWICQPWVPVSLPVDSSARAVFWALSVECLFPSAPEPRTVKRRTPSSPSCHV